MMSAYVFAPLMSLVMILILSVGCSHNRTDAEIATEVQTKINADLNMGTNQIKVASNNGVVTLSGTVDGDFQRTAAQNDAAQVRSVKAVVNNLQLASNASAPSSAGSHAQRASRTSNSPAKRSKVPAQVITEDPKQPEVITVPEGTSVSIRLIDSVDSDKNKIGDIFSATLESPLMAGGRIAVPKGADVEGKIQEVKSAGHFAGRSELVLVLSKVSFNGKTYMIETDEYIKQGSSRGARTAETVAAGSAVGALIGGLTAGGKGALMGAGAGAGAGTGVQALTKGQQIHLGSESVLEFQLKSPATVEVSAVNRDVNRAMR
jgi:hypothetical protein